MAGITNNGHIVVWNAEKDETDEVFELLYISPMPLHATLPDFTLLLVLLDGSKLIVADAQGHIWLHDPDGYPEYEMFQIARQSHRGTIMAIDAASDSTSFFTAATDRTAKLWDTDGNLLETLRWSQ